MLSVLCYAVIAIFACVVIGIIIGFIKASCIQNNRTIFRVMIAVTAVFAIVVSAFAFGLLHTISAETGLYSILVQSLQYVGMGAVMAYVYTKTNNIGTNMTIHCIQNTVAVILSMLMF